MINKIYVFGTLFVFCVCLFTFTACSDSDNDDGGDIPSKGVALYNGKLITKVGGAWFKYDEKNRCSSFGENRYDNYTIDYTQGVIVTDDEEEKINVSFNSKCYITRYRWKSFSEYYNEEEDLSLSFTYDGSGHLTSITGKSKYTDNNEDFEDIENATVKLSWKNGNLVNITSTTEAKDNDGGYEKEINEFTIKYGTEENIWLQPVYSLLYEFLPEEVECLGHIGMFGVGPANFPVSIYVKTTNTNNESGKNKTTTTEDDTNVSVSTNTDGTINYEYCQNGYLYYSYNFANDDADYTRAAVLSPINKIFKKHILFKHRARHIKNNR